MMDVAETGRPDLAAVLVSVFVVVFVAVFVAVLAMPVGLLTVTP
jgi:hypothetical protein